MASFDYRLNPLYTIKECSSCGALYTTDYCCSKGSLVDKIVRNPDETPNLSQRIPNCPNCGDSADGLYCQPCAFVRKCLNEGWFTIHDENEILNTSESSNDDTNVVSAPQEPFVVKQDPGKNSSQSPPHIDHNCCYEYGDSLDDIFCQRYTSYGANDIHVLIWLVTIYAKEEEEKRLRKDQEAKDRYVRSEGFPGKNVIDCVLFVDHLTPLEASKDHYEIIVDSNDDSTSSDDDSPYEIVAPEVGGIAMDILLTINYDILHEKLLTVNLLIAKIEALKDNPIPSSDLVPKSSSTSPNFFLEETNNFDNSLPETKTFCFNLEEISSDSTTTHSDFFLSRL
ncbi:hypothetical protein Tco_1191857 [Tanacetum coccineum]